MENISIYEACYQTYGQVLNSQHIEGKPFPNWDMISKNEQEAWKAAINKAQSFVMCQTV